MDITKMTKQELEALGYQQIKELNRIQSNISAIEREIDKRVEEEPKKEK